jgi:hypothetical protein
MSQFSNAHGRLAQSIFRYLLTCTFYKPYIAGLLAIIEKCASFICWEGGLILLNA